MKKIVAALAVLALLSCSAKQEVPAPDFTPAAGKGIAVGSITFEDDVPHNDIYRFFYQALSADKKFNKANSGKIEIKARENNQRAWTGDMNNKRTYFFVIERDPGNYAFTQYSYLDHIGYSGMVSSSGKFSIPFRITQGSISYIGELSYNDNAIKGTARLRVSDNYYRDVEGLKKRFPSVNWELAKNETVKSGDTGNGIVEFQLQ